MKHLIGFYPRSSASEMLLFGNRMIRTNLLEIAA